MTVDNYALTALGAVGYGSGNYSGAGYNGPIDGDDATWWQGQYLGVTNNWWKCDLDTAPTITVLRILQSTDAQYQASSIRVAVSDDNLTYDDLIDLTPTSHDYTVNIPATAARWWRFTPLAGGASRWRLFTVEICGDTWTDPLPQSGVLSSEILMKYTQASTEVETARDGLSLSPLYTGDYILQLTVSAWTNWLCNKIWEAVNQLGGGGNVHTIDEVWQYVHDLYAQVGEDATGTPPDVVTLHEKLDAIDTKLGTPADTLAADVAGVLAEVDAQALALAEAIGTVGTDVANLQANVDVIDGVVDGISSTVTDLHDDLSHVHTDLASHDTALAAARAVIDAIASDLTMVKATVNTINGNTDQLEGYTDELEALLKDANYGLAALKAAIEAIVPGGGSDARYPGPAAVSWGTPCELVGEGTVSAGVYGVGGLMDGVAVTITSTPQRVTSRLVQGVNNYRFAGWLAFEDSSGFFDEPQWFNLDQRIYIPKNMRRPAAVCVGFVNGVEATVTPWLIP